MSFDNSFDEDETDYTGIISKRDTAREQGVINGGRIATNYLEDTHYSGQTADGIEEDDLAEMFITTHSILKELIDIPVYKRAHDFYGLIIETSNEQFIGPTCVSRNPDLVIDGNYIEGSFNGEKIQLFLKTIARNFCSKDKSGHLILVLLHELMHGSMNVKWNRPSHPYWTFREEALANFLLINALDSISNKSDIYSRAQKLKSLAEEEFSNQIPDLGYTYFKYLKENEKDVDAWMKEKKECSQSREREKIWDEYIKNARALLESKGEKLQGK